MKFASSQALALLAVVTLAGCVARGPLGRGLSAPSEGTALMAGDVLLGIEGLDPRKESESRIVRYRRTRLDGAVRVEARTLVSVPGQPLRVQGSADGSWLAATVQSGGDVQTRLWRLRDGEAQPAWVSPVGCRSPSFDPEARFLVLACPPAGRQPSWLLRVGLPDLGLLALVGERPRSAPVVGVEGDLYWAERTGSHTVVMRRTDTGVPYVTHQLFDAVDSLHPRDDGVLVAAVRTAHGGLELLDLVPSGRVVPRAMPVQLGVGSPTRVSSSARGDLLAIRCLRGDCAVVDAPIDGDSFPAMTVSGRPLALSEVPRRGATHPRPEDLATAPDTVLATHLSSDVAVLGVALGMRLEAAWAVLEEAGLQPWWEAAVGSRARPRAIGVGRGAGSWCVEFRADERGVIAAVDMRECAASYVSPAIRPLLDRKNLMDGAMTIARRYLGPGVSMEVGDGVGSPGESRSHPVRKTTLQYDAPERGYHYRSETEVLESRSRRLWDGKVWLRLQPPGKRQATRP